MIHAFAPILSALLCVLPSPEEDRGAEKLLDGLNGLRDVAIEGEVRAFWRTQHDVTPLAKGTFTIETHGSKGGRLRMEIPGLGSAGKGGFFETGFGGGGSWDLMGTTGTMSYDDTGIPRLLCALTGGAAWREHWKDAALDAKAAPLPAGASAVRLSPSAAPDGDLFVIDAPSSKLVEARIQLAMGKNRTLNVSVRHEGALGRGATITIDREHYRFVLAVETLGAGPGPDAFNLPSFMQDRKEPTFPMTEIVTLDEVHTAHVRKRVRMAEISKEMATLLPAVMNHVRAQGVQPAGPPYSRYWSMPGEEIDVEVGFPVARPLPETDTIKAGKLPGGRTISTWHVGPYHEMGRTWQSAMAWMTENKLTGRGAPWEVYWTDPGLEPDSSKWRTQILLPVQ